MAGDGERLAAVFFVKLVSDDVDDLARRFDFHVGHFLLEALLVMLLKQLTPPNHYQKYL